ncbi:hypothetical protein L332_03390 [Agrococcus pavilionensis RW1]|uniref:Uncharacterized protein n=1 Tax=Agrococcus pavilionensis RW1 TaxID=1330458 RepID=U1LME0_9MICO|nr:hypothetical protein [Agrococcus pavilionensis]ERG63499.1 hypothetical protein L332_03390 [Agrococcus pavilionensis RW1]
MDVQVSALVVEVGVNMGDHAQDVTRAVEVRRDETVGEVVDRLLTSSQWVSLQMGHQQMPQTSWRLELRAVEPAPVKVGVGS